MSAVKHYEHIALFDNCDMILYPHNEMDLIERDIYAAICSHDGIKAREISRYTTADRHVINQYLYRSPFMKELCYRDDDHYWHGSIRQARPHTGLADYCGYYSTVNEFLALSEEEWFSLMLDGCAHIGRNLNDTRGLFHSFRDTRAVMVDLFSDLSGINAGDWEIAFELRINRAKYIRIYADVLVITEDKVFSLEFKMKDVILPEELQQAAKYAEYLEVLFGPKYDVISALVLTRAQDLYSYQPFGKTDAELPVCSGDMLFNLFDEYLGFLNQ